MEALCDHFSGEVNATRRIIEVDIYNETFHYKNLFLTKCQKMYKIQVQHGEVMQEDVKIRCLFKKIQGLESSVEATKAKIITEQVGIVAYINVVNYIVTAISELPDYLSRNHQVSEVTDR